MVRGPAATPPATVEAFRCLFSEFETQMRKMSMLQWLMWLRGERAAAKHEAERPEAVKPQEPPATKEAVRAAVSSAPANLTSFRS